jgi:hypothetical protein
MLGIAAGLACAATTAATFTAQPSAVQSYLQDGGFETPNLAAGEWVQGSTTGSAVWTSESGGGIGANGSPWAAGNAPEGDQYGFVQGGAISFLRQSFTAPAGRYRLTFKATQRNDGSATALAVLLDGVKVAEARPASTSFEPFVFDALKLAAGGTHTLTFQGTSALGHSVAIDDVRFVSATNTAWRWDDAATWNQGSALPGASDDVVIPAGSAVLLPTAGQARTITIDGELHCNDANATKLSAEWVMVMGRFTCGSPSSPYVDNFTLTLVGLDDKQDHHGMGDKFLSAMGSGAIELHGRKRTSFVRLMRNASAGDTGIWLPSGVDWRSGDKLVIAPTRWNDSGVIEAEEVTIASIGLVQGSDGTTLASLVQPLVYPHYGAAPTTYSKPDASHAWVLDERADVGLLTRNIVIQGDGTSNQQNAGYGGHMMTMRGSTVHASGIELYRMGQKGLLARYPFHWHLVRDAPGQYIENSSIHESYNRCVTVHGTHRVRVADNVCYDFLGHGYFLENGNEKYNVFDHNLGVLARRPAVPLPGTNPELPLETDYREATASNGPAVFWISHPLNTFTNNSAAGGQGSGYWYHLMPTPYDPRNEPGGSDLEPDGKAPKDSQFGVFDNNRAYASRQGFSSCLDGGGTPGLDTPYALATRLVTTSVAQGIWPCGAGRMHFNETIVANTENGMQAPLPMSFSDSLFVAYTPGNRPARALDVPWGAVWVYDQGFDFDNVHFVNYDGPAMSVFMSSAGAHKSSGNRTRRLSFTNSPHLYRDIPENWKSGIGSYWGEAINDLDGTLVGKDPLNGKLRALVTDHPLMSDATCSRHGGTGNEGYACPYRYGVLMLDQGLPYVTPGGSPATAPPLTVVRSDGVHDTSVHGFIAIRGFNTYIANGGYRYGYRFVDGIQRDVIDMSNVWSPLDSSVTFEIMDVPGDSFVFPTDQWVRKDDLAALEGSTGNAFYYRETSASMFVKLHAQRLLEPSYDNEWDAAGTGFLCLGCTVDNDPVRPMSHPTVQIVSPADGARVTGGTVTVTANVSDSDGLAWAQLWIGDHTGSRINLGSSGNSTTVTTSVTVPPGSYPLKLVVMDRKANAPQSYTAIQQVHVGDDGSPRIEITNANLPAVSTYVAGTIPALTYGVYNWNATDQHVHWLVDGVDQGEAPAGGIPLDTLGQGKHVVEVALAYAVGKSMPHHILPVRDRRTIYVVQNGWVADYEDGVDLRATFAHRPGSTVDAVVRPYPNLARTGRIDPAEDDLNYFYLPTAVAGTRATYTLTLDPPLDVSAWAKLAVTYKLSGFQAFLRYHNEAALVPLTPLADSASVDTIKTFNLPARTNTQVTGVVLKFTDAPSTCCLGQFNLSGIRLTNP